MLENVETGQIRGTCQIFGAVGTDRPFYSYLISTLTVKSEELSASSATRPSTSPPTLKFSEVGGLFLHPQERAGGLGMLLARSRYLFIKQHRPRFGSVLAELRGVMDQSGNSSGTRSAGDFRDELSGSRRVQCGPRHAIHRRPVPQDPDLRLDAAGKRARGDGPAAPDRPGCTQDAGKRGFDWDSYIDIFDGGPTVTCRTDKIKTVMESEWRASPGSMTMADRP